MTAAPTPGAAATTGRGTSTPDVPTAEGELSEAEYHRHPALSQSGAKLLLPPNCPALYRWRMDNGQPHKAVFDFGHAAHKMVLGVGAEIRTVDADSWRTKAAQSARDEAYEIGEIPLLAAESAVLTGMIKALLAHPLAAALFKPGAGKAEHPLFWTDEDSGVDLRGRLDWFPNKGRGRLVVPDYKTSRSANPESFAKSAADYGYHQQAAWYLDGIKALGLDSDPVFVFVVQEKTAPYLVSVVELDATAISIGRGLNRKAIQTFKACTESGTWPGYSNDVELVGLPVWYQRNNEEFAA